MLAQFFIELTTISYVIKEGKEKINKDEKSLVNNANDIIKSAMFNIIKKLYLQRQG